MLKEIITAKKRQLEAIDLASETYRLQADRLKYPAAISLAESIRQNENISLIAEIKRRSPSKGLLKGNLDVVATVQAYTEAGARAISILTETEFFDGSLDDLAAARKVTELPLLRKDFILTEFQIWESRAAGADAILLIAACLDSATMANLMAVTAQAGLEALVEVHTAEELQEVLPLQPKLVAINNRNLKTFEVDLTTVSRLAAIIPDDILIISASGVFSRTEMQTLASQRIDAVLVGEALVKADDPGKKIAELLGESV